MLQRQHTTVIYIPSLRTDPPTVGLNLQALKSLLPWSVGELVTGVHPLAQNPSYLTWRWHLDVKDGVNRERLSSSVYHFGGPFPFPFDIFINQQEAGVDGIEREGSSQRVWDTREGNSCLWDCSNVWAQEKESFCFRVVLPLHRGPFICAVQTKAPCISDEAETSGSACRRSNERGGRKHKHVPGSETACTRGRAVVFTNVDAGQKKPEDG